MPELREGIYSGQVESCDFTETKTGKPMIVLTVMVHQVQTTEGFESIAPVTRTVRLVCDPSSEKQIDFVTRKLRHAGWDGNRFEELQAWFPGEWVEMEQKGDTYEGRVVESWDLCLPRLEVENKPEVAKKLNAIFGKKLKATKPVKRPTSPGGEERVQAASPVSDDDDDDTPF